MQYVIRMTYDATYPKSSGWHNDEIWVSHLDDLLAVISHPGELRQIHHVIQIT